MAVGAAAAPSRGPRANVRVRDGVGVVVRATGCALARVAPLLEPIDDDVHVVEHVVLDVVVDADGGGVEEQRAVLGQRALPLLDDLRRDVGLRLARGISMVSSLASTEKSPSR